jgi:DNA-directed RNA polymerase beta' subunit
MIKIDNNTSIMQSILKEAYTPIYENGPYAQHIFKNSHNIVPLNNGQYGTTMSYTKLSEIKLITIGLASAQKIRQWTEKTLPNGKVIGRVTNANTLHHKTFKPQKGGLFCDRIFGPLKDFTCACDKVQKPTTSMLVVEESSPSPAVITSPSSIPSLSSGGNGNGNGSEGLKNAKKEQLQKLIVDSSKDNQNSRPITSNRKFCPICDVEYTWSVIRRYQLGYIQLISPVTHIWYLKGNPSYISLLLDMKKRHVEFVTYCTETLTLENSLKGNIGRLTNNPSKIYSTWEKIIKKMVSNSPMGPVSTSTIDMTVKSNSFETKNILVNPALTKTNHNQIKVQRTLSNKQVQEELQKRLKVQPKKRKSYLMINKPSQVHSPINLILKVFLKWIDLSGTSFGQKLANSQFSSFSPSFSESLAAPIPFGNGDGGGGCFFPFPQRGSGERGREVEDEASNSLWNKYYMKNLPTSIYIYLNLQLVLVKEVFKHTASYAWKEISKNSIKSSFYKLRLMVFKSEMFQNHKKDLLSIPDKNWDSLANISAGALNVNTSDFLSLGLDKMNKYSILVQNVKHVFMNSFLLFLKKLTTNQDLGNVDGLYLSGNALSLGINYFMFYELSNEKAKSFLSLKLISLFLKDFTKNPASLTHNGCQSLKEKEYNTLSLRDEELSTNQKQITLNNYLYKNIFVSNLSNYFSILLINKNLEFMKSNHPSLFTQSSYDHSSKADSFLQLFKKHGFLLEGPEKRLGSSLLMKHLAFDKQSKTTLSLGHLISPKQQHNQFSKDQSSHQLEKVAKPLDHTFSTANTMTFVNQGSVLPKLVNNVYTLSHRERWVDGDWQNLNDYMSVPYLDKFSLIPAYRNRIVPIGTAYPGQNPQSLVKGVGTGLWPSLKPTNNALYSGPGIIQQLLNEFDFSSLKKIDKQNRILLYQLNKHIFTLKKQVKNKKELKELKECIKKRDQLIRRTKLIRIFYRKNTDPNSMVLTVLPVLPPDLRPIVKIGGQIAASDLNRLYQRVIYRNDRLQKFLKDPATNSSYEMKYAQRLLQEAVDNLIQNGKSGVAADARGRALKSLSDLLKGKQGRFRQYLLGKRVDYSGRSVIVVGPKLKLHECGIPKEMALELYLPFLLKRILNQNYARTVVGAKILIKKNPSLVWELLKEIMQTSPVLLNRAPTLHRLGFQAFQPKLIEGRAILLHPLVCPAFNADFDGDQMAVHVPITVEARAEAWKLMCSRNNFLSPATGEPLAIPSQDMVLGCYYLTTNCNKKTIKYQKGSGLHFSNFSDVLNAYHRRIIDLHARVWVKLLPSHKIQQGNNVLEGSILEIRMNSSGNWQEIYQESHNYYQTTNLINRYICTTPGRILFNFTIQKCLVK